MKLEVRTSDGVVFKFDLEESAEYVLGASASSDFQVKDESFLSRRHALLQARDGNLLVQKIAEAKNPILVKGAAADRFQISPGEFFIIGATTFFLLDSAARRGRRSQSSAQLHDEVPSYQMTLAADDLKTQRETGDRIRLLDLLELPEVLRTQSRSAFFIYACGALRSATSATWVRVLQMTDQSPVVLAEDSETDEPTSQPVSRSLLNASIKEAPKPVAYSWNRSQSGDISATLQEGIDWAVSCAMPLPGEEPIVLYLAGGTSGTGGRAMFDAAAGVQMSLHDTSRLVRLVADMIGRTLATKRLESWKSRLGGFFSERLFAKILEGDGEDALSPKIVEATVMFFDIRGFSEKTEGNLERILAYEGELRRALTAMTECVFDHDGIVLRYMGDGFLACWNTPYSYEDHVERACLAATEMSERLKDATDGWECGIGLDVGDVVAGSLGSDHQHAYDILGAVANLASRVEGITKTVGVPILVTDEVARRLNADSILTRRVARFLPLGTNTEVDLFTIERTPEDLSVRKAVEERFAVHATALESFEQGDWESAFDLLHPIVREDSAARYVYTLALQRKPPRDWSGVVVLASK